MKNLTPHDIVLQLPSGERVTLPPSGTVARVSTIATDTGLAMAGVRVVRNTYGPVQGLPADGGPCIVSGMVLAALPAGTPNVYAPATGATAIRDERGQVIAVTELVAA